MLRPTAQATARGSDRRRKARAMPATGLAGPLATLLSLGCAAAPPSEVSDRPILTNATLARVEDRSLHARLGGASAIATIAGYWAEQTQARTRLPFDTGVRRAQYLLDCIVGPGRGAAPPSTPVPLTLDEDSPSELIADLRQTLRRLRITAPEQREVLQKLQQFLAENRR